MWFKAIGFEDKLEVTKCGRVRSIDRVVKNWPSGERKINGRELSGTVSRTGYIRIDLRSRAKGKNIGGVYLLHRIIALTFLAVDSEKTVVNHIDGNKLNNSASNLEWCTAKENSQHAWRTGLCNSQKKPVICHNKKGEGMWYPSMHSPVGCNPSLIHAAINGRQLTHRGLTWEYARLMDKQND